MRLPILVLAAACCTLVAAKAEDDPAEASKACAEYYFGYSQFSYNIELGGKFFEAAKDKLRRLIPDCQKSSTHCQNTLTYIPKAIEKNEGKSLPPEFTLTCPGSTAQPPAAAPGNDRPDPPEAISACSDYYRVLDALFDNTGDGRLVESDRALIAPFKLRRTMSTCGKSRKYCLNTVEMVNKKRKGNPLPAGFTLTCSQR
jgi:hypothetical protein